MASERRWQRTVLAGAGGVAAIAVIVVALRAVQDHPNPTIAALLFLLVVLATATVAHLRVAIAISPWRRCWRSTSFCCRRSTR